MKSKLFAISVQLYYVSVFILILLGLDYAAKLLNISGSIVQLIVGVILFFIHIKIEEKEKLRNVDLVDKILTEHRENDGAPNAMIQCAICREFEHRQ